MLAPVSRLSRLYTYSKDTAFDAQENFATEALAIAIADDPIPMIEALRRVDAQEAARVGLAKTADVLAGTVTLVPSTQVALPEGGRLDLVLNVRSDRSAVLGAIWVEVKINASESGLQLDVYNRVARKTVVPVWLVTLAHAPLRESVPNLTWYKLYRTVRHARRKHSSWTDLLAFLEEQNVANDALGPISDAEAASLESAYQLAQKVTEIVKVVHRALPDVFGNALGAKLRWKAEGELLNYLGANFRQAGELWGAGKALRYGLTAHEGTAYWTVAVMSEGIGRATVDVARKKADEARFGGEWERPASGSSILVARTRATALDSHEAAVKWFEKRLRELADSRVLDLIVGFGQDVIHPPAVPGPSQQHPSSEQVTEPLETP